MKNQAFPINRSGAKWLPGAMALAATAVDSQAATVQITLTGNKISTSGGNALNADLTGDGTSDFVLQVFPTLSTGVGLKINGGALCYALRTSSSTGDFSVNARGGASAWGDGSKIGAGPVSATAGNPISFSDARINGGAVTGAWLEVRAFNNSSTTHTVELTRLIFDDASVTRPGFTSIPGVQTEWVPATVPEPSSFALLGLGAAGVLARRRRQAA